MAEPHQIDRVELYRRLYLARRADETIQAHYAEDEMKTPVHLSIGQEAIPVGVLAALDARDRIFATYRNHALYLARTLDTDGFFGELYGRASGAACGKAGSMHLASPAAGLVITSAVVGTTIPLALGAALAAERRGTGARAVTFFGDGAIDEGVFFESANFAALHRLPLLFVCEDNGLAIHARAEERHGYDSIADLVERFRIDVVRSETSDALEIAELTARALSAMRTRRRPVFMHLRCYRFVEHVGTAIDRQFELGYRRRDEFEHWQRLDPVRVLRERLRREGVDELALSSLEKEVDARVETSLRRAREAPLPAPAELHQDVFA